MKRKKIIVAGMLVKECVYSSPAGREDARIRAEKRKISTAAQQRINAKYSWQKLELMLAANFDQRDLVVTLTYDEKHLPQDRKAANARLRAFRARLAQLRKDRKRELRMIWTTENRSGGGRWHHHCVINAVSAGDFRDILSCWPEGTDVEIRRLELSSEKTYESLAKYMTKEARERAGLRSWSYTRSCRHPEVETFAVPEETQLEAPAGVTVLETAQDRTQWGEYSYVKYLCADPLVIRKRRPSRRKRRRAFY